MKAGTFEVVWYLMFKDKNIMRKYISILSIVVCLFAFQDATSQTRATTKTKAKLTVISCGVCIQRAIDLPKPDYPAAARYVNAAGEVGVSILVDEEGNVIAADAVTGHPLLGPASERAARKAKFEPFRLGKRLVRVQRLIIYKFVLDSHSLVEIRSAVATDESLRKLPIVNGRATSLPKPDYPEGVKSGCASGFVDVKVNIDEAGNVEKATAIRGDELLGKAAESAASKATFTNHGHAPRAKWTGRIRYNFPVPDGCPVK